MCLPVSINQFVTSNRYLSVSKGVKPKIRVHVCHKQKRLRAAATYFLQWQDTNKRALQSNFRPYISQEE